VPDPQLFKAHYTSQSLTITSSTKGHLKLVVKYSSKKWT